MPKPARRSKMPAYAERIAWMREVTDVASKELDRLAGTTKGHAYLLETQPVHGVSAQTLSRLAKVFEVSIDWLYKGEGSEPSETHLRAAVARSRAVLAGKRTKRSTRAKGQEQGTSARP